MPSLREALESALLENPDDVATHHAYADYLQEQGDPRGEFIQLQLALEDGKRSEAERRHLQARIKELLGEHQREWLGSLAEDLLPQDNLDWVWPLPTHLTEHHFARGWLDSLVLRRPNSLVHHRELVPLLSRAPEARLLRKLTVEYDDGLIDAIAGSAFLHNLRVLQVGKAVSDFHDLAEMVNSPQLPDLIARLSRIEELRLFAQGYDPGRLFALPNLTSLRVLQVYYLAEPLPLEVLADNAALGNLTHLLLHPHGFAEALVDLGGVRAVVQSPHLRNVIHLQLHCSDLGDVGCSEIATCGILKRLRVLDLRHGEITDNGARILAGCPDLQRLELLDVERNALTQAGIDALRRVLGPALRGDNQQTPEELERRQYLYDEDFV